MRKDSSRRALAGCFALVSALSSALPARDAEAFCGFYVAGSNARLLNRATNVVLMRSGVRTVLSMQNAYEGPPENFAMVVPVPIVLDRNNVKVLPRSVFDRIEQLAAPRLVEYWEQDPCAPEAPMMQGLGAIGIGRGGGGFGSGSGYGLGVRVEAQFEVGEYDVVILSARDSAGLDTWLRQERYNIPDGAAPILAPYVRAGMKFFVAKVNVGRVRFEQGRAALSPLRFHYDSPEFSLPVRLGLLNSPGAQELVVHILARNQRFEAANRPNITIPTNLDVSESVKGQFAEFYNALFDRELQRHPGAVVTEYAWDASTCDPCPIPALSSSELATLGADVLTTPLSTPTATPPSTPSTPLQPLVRATTPMVVGLLSPEVVRRVVWRNIGQVRFCYEQGVARKPNLQGIVNTQFVISTTGSVSASSVASSTINDPATASCIANAVRRWSFPAPEQGIVRVTYPFNLQLVPGSPSGFGRWGGYAGFVLTRLHLRYGSELSEDLVFREAEPIQGGREQRDNGALEQGAQRGYVNNFQSRYAIRHPWTGPVACANPRRGVWGGPPNAADGPGAPQPIAARGLAFAARTGGAQLSQMLNTGASLSDAGPQAPDAGAPGPSSAPPSRPSSTQPAARRGCSVREHAVTRTSSQTRGTWAGAALALVLAARRRRAPRR
ncbi:MAG: DUF2330 domain-containing protein [Myxococcales bacterium]|nr:DUF2330 domain-containing protein [Myxococcales bacterium]